jgi:hypothetical protein
MEEDVVVEVAPAELTAERRRALARPEQRLELPR